VEYGLFDWLLVILIGLLTLLIDQLEPYHKPLSELQLADPNINLSFEPSIVPNSVLVFVAIALPAILIAALFPFRRRQAGATVEVRLAMLAFCMCILLNLLATAFGKKYVGRPRPNFVRSVGMTDSSSPEPQLQLVRSGRLSSVALCAHCGALL